LTFVFGILLNGIASGSVREHDLDIANSFRDLQRQGTHSALADFFGNSRQVALTTLIVTRLWIPVRFVTLQTTSKAWHAPMRWF
jgi:hypothetical protein